MRNMLFVKGRRIGVSLLLAVTAVLPTLGQSLPASAATDDWTTYLHDAQHTGASSDTTMSAANVSQLTPKWTAQTGGVISASVTVSGTTAYLGSWDGYEYAFDTATGNVKWKTFLGITTADPICIPNKLGVGSTAALSAGTLYVGGGDAYWYALDPASGAVKWKLFTGDNSAVGGHFNWSSPLILGNNAYIGITSLGDCPLVQGKLLKVDLTTHQVSASFNYVPDGEIGGGLWTSPSYDPGTNTIFTTTGTENSRTQAYAQAFVAHNADTLAVTSSWRLPEDQAVLDSDFSTTPTLFNDANGRPLAVSINKNGKAYALDRRNLAAGPVWSSYVAEGGACPTCGESSVSSGAYGGGRLYLAGETTTINGVGYPGSVRAVDPTTGNPLWAHPTTGPVLGALTYANGVVYASSGSIFEALDAATGQRLFSYDMGSDLYSAPTVAGGRVYVGNLA
jgi:outer membrane protein assembly factor BamB